MIKANKAYLQNCEGFMYEVELVEKINNHFETTKKGMTLDGLTNLEPKDFFRITESAAPLCGKGVVLGSDREGESVDVKISLEELADAVSWGLADGQAEPQAGFTFIALDDLEVQS